MYMNQTFIITIFKIRAYFVSTLIAFTLIASISPQTALAKEETFLVGFAQDNMSSLWRAQQVLELEKALKKYPSVKFIYTDARGQVAKAVNDIETLRQEGIDLLVVSPHSPSLTSPVISSVYRSGIPVVLMTRRITGDSYTSFIAPDDYGIGVKAADEVANSLSGKGNVFILEGLPSASTAVDRTLGFENQIKKYPDIRITIKKTGNYLQKDARKAVRDALNKGIQFDAIYSHSDSMAIGARRALRKAGIDPKDIPIIGIDYIRQAQDAIKLGEQKVSFTYPTCSQETSKVIWDILRGIRVDKHIKVPSQTVTADNVNSVEPIF